MPIKTLAQPVVSFGQVPNWEFLNYTYRPAPDSRPLTSFSGPWSTFKPSFTSGEQELREVYNKSGYITDPVMSLELSFFQSGLPYALKYLCQAYNANGPLGKWDEKALLSFFGPKLGTFLIQQGSPTGVHSMLKNHPVKCVQLFGMVLPPHFKWHDPYKKAAPPAKAVSTTTEVQDYDVNVPVIVTSNTATS